METTIQKPSLVVVAQCKTYEVSKIKRIISNGIAELGGMESVIGNAKTILLKPNLLAPDPPERATTTHPAVFEASARVFLEAGIHVQYGDSPSFHDPFAVAKKAGLHEVALKLHMEAADFKHGRKIFFKDAVQNKVFTIAQGIFNVDGIVSLPKLKTHGLTLLTAAIKNQFGCIPGTTKAGFHAKLNDVSLFSQMLVDLTMYLKPKLYIMDGILAMEGNGPRRGNPVPLGILLISKDPVAIDAVASRIVGLDPYNVITTVRGATSGLGNIDNVKIVGNSIEEVYKKFSLPRYRGNFNTLPPFIRKTVKRLFIPVPVIDYKKCIKCYECYKVCPTNPKSIYINDKKFPVHNYSTCINCYCCQENCPEGAITLKIRPLRRG